MPLDYEKLVKHVIPDVVQLWSRRDTMLYALGVGFGADPRDAGQLTFVYEKNLQAVPSMAVVICMPHGWLQRADAGMSGKNVAAEHSFVIHKPLPVEGTFVGKTRITGIVDKGPGRGALVRIERKVYEHSTGDLVCTHISVSYCRGDGGFGGPSGPVQAPHRMPERVPDAVCEFPTLPQSALIYRLSGDVNPLHIDPGAAGKAGYPRPILHGLCSMGYAVHAILKSFCGYDSKRMKSTSVRFSAPVFPGERLRIDMWRDQALVSFRALVLPRNVVVLNSGRARISLFRAGGHEADVPNP